MLSFLFHNWKLPLLCLSSTWAHSTHKLKENKTANSLQTFYFFIFYLFIFFFQKQSENIYYTEMCTSYY